MKRALAIAFFSALGAAAFAATFSLDPQIDPLIITSESPAFRVTCAADSGVEDAAVEDADTRPRFLYLPCDDDAADNLVDNRGTIDIEHCTIGGDTTAARHTHSNCSAGSAACLIGDSDSWYSTQCALPVWSAPQKFSFAGWFYQQASNDIWLIWWSASYDILTSTAFYDHFQFDMPTPTDVVAKSNHGGGTHFCIFFDPDDTGAEWRLLIDHGAGGDYSWGQDATLNAAATYLYGGLVESQTQDEIYIVPDWTPGSDLAESAWCQDRFDGDPWSP